MSKAAKDAGARHRAAGRGTVPVDMGEAEPKRRKKPFRTASPPLLTLPDLIRLLDGIAIEGLAEESGMTARDIVAALPVDSRSFVPVSKFVEVMDTIAEWGEVTILLRTPDGVVEITTVLPRGELAHGSFHWLGDGPFRGHFQLEQCAGIAFVRRSFMGRPSAFVLFFNLKGGIMFKIMVRREGRNGLAEDQLKRFEDLASRLGRPFSEPMKP